jgi:hypothetical protein
LELRRIARDGMHDDNLRALLKAVHRRLATTSAAS